MVVADEEVWFTVHRELSVRLRCGLSGKQRMMLRACTLRLFDSYPDGRVLLGAGHERVLMTGIAATVRRRLVVVRLDKQHRMLRWQTGAVDEQSQFAGAGTVGVRSIEGSPPIRLGDGELSKHRTGMVGAAIPGQGNHFMLLPTEQVKLKLFRRTGAYCSVSLGDGRLLLIGFEPGRRSLLCSSPWVAQWLFQEAALNAQLPGPRQVVSYQNEGWAVHRGALERRHRVHHVDTRIRQSLVLTGEVRAQCTGLINQQKQHWETTSRGPRWGFAADLGNLAGW
jgi:hypothetical protein